MGPDGGGRGGSWAARAAALVVVAVLSGCGTRVPHAEVLAAAIGPGRATAADGKPAGSDQPTATDGAPVQSADEGGLSATAPAGAAATTPKTNGRTPGATAPGGGPSEPPAGPAGPKAPVVIGDVGNFSGIVGAALAPARDALGAWVQNINAKGGIDGHPVKLLVGDDGGDAARSMSIARDFVERQGAIALVNYVGSGIATISKYAEQKRVPVIGGLPDESWFASWVMFPTQPPQANYGYAEAKVSADAGVTKVATLYCVEAAPCRDSEQAYVTNARQVGLQVVYEGAMSLVAPDYTAECLQAKGKGAQLIVPVADGNSITRIAQSCARQNYRPLIVNLSPSTEQAKVPELDGMIAVIRDFPWFLTSGSPALDEYDAVLATYGGGKTRQFQSAIGWSAAKLFERAAAGHLSATPTSQDVLAGLWTVKGETLGGLVAPMTFPEMKPVVPANCAFLAKVAAAKWTAPLGMQLTGCRPA